MLPPRPGRTKYIFVKKENYKDIERSNLWGKRKISVCCVLGIIRNLKCISLVQNNEDLSAIKFILFLEAYFCDIQFPYLCCVQLGPTLCDPMDCSLPGSSENKDSPGKHTRVGCHALLQGIFPTQDLNPGLSYCRWILYHLSQQGSTRSLEFYLVFRSCIKLFEMFLFLMVLLFKIYFYS